MPTCSAAKTVQLQISGRGLFAALAFVLCIVLANGPQLAAQDASLTNGRSPVGFTKGDVFVAVGSGRVKEFTPAGELVQTLGDDFGYAMTAGLAFDRQGNLYVTNYYGGSISKFDVHGNLADQYFISGTQRQPESITMVNGQFPMLVGDAELFDPHGNGIINQYDATGHLLNSFSVSRGIGDTNWVDLQSDRQTVLYTSEGSTIFSYNIATQMQNPSLTNNLPQGRAYALATFRAGPHQGDTALANGLYAFLIGSDGTVLHQYTLPGNAGADLALAIDPSETAFWTADYRSGNVWEVDVASGNILHQWNGGAPGVTAGLAVFAGVCVSPQCIVP